MRWRTVAFWNTMSWVAFASNRSPANTSAELDRHCQNPPVAAWRMTHGRLRGALAFPAAAPGDPGRKGSVCKRHVCRAAHHPVVFPFGHLRPPHRRGEFLAHLRPVFPRALGKCAAFPIFILSGLAGIAAAHWAAAGLFCSPTPHRPVCRVDRTAVARHRLEIFFAGVSDA